MKVFSLFLLLLLVTSIVQAQDSEDTLDQLRAELKLKPVEARELLVEELCKQKLYKEAADHYRWLWENEIEPDRNPVRTRIFLEQLPLGVLIELEYYLEGVKSRYFWAARGRRPGPVEVATWVVFEMEFGEPQSVVDWYLGLTNPEAEVYELSRPWIFQILVEKEMWQEAGSVFPDPAAYAIHLMGVWELIEEGDPSFRETTDLWAVTTFGNLHRCLLAAERAEEAERLKEVVLAKRATDELRRAFGEDG